MDGGRGLGPKLTKRSGKGKGLIPSKREEVAESHDLPFPEKT